MFPAGSINGSTQCIDITITDDDVLEADETFIYTDVTGKYQDTVTITDNEGYNYVSCILYSWGWGGGGGGGDIGGGTRGVGVQQG